MLSVSGSPVDGPLLLGLQQLKAQLEALPEVFEQRPVDSFQTVTSCCIH